MASGQKRPGCGWGKPQNLFWQSKRRGIKLITLARSMKYADAASLALYRQPAFQRATLKTLSPAAVRPQDYIAIYYAGGRGVMWDFPADAGLRQVAETIYQQGGYVTAVCHGIAGLLNLRRPNGEYLLVNRQVTGFTTGEEVLAGKRWQKKNNFLGNKMRVGNNLLGKPDG